MHGLQASLFYYITFAAFRIYLSVVKMQLKRGGWRRALKSHGNYIVDHGKSWKNHGIVFLNFCRNPDCLFSGRLLTSTPNRYLFFYSKDYKAQKLQSISKVSVFFLRPCHTITFYLAYADV